MISFRLLLKLLVKAVLTSFEGSLMKTVQLNCSNKFFLGGYFCWVCRNLCKAVFSFYILLCQFSRRSELKKVTDIFSRMFYDPHGKVFSVFMETLVDLVAIHHDDLIDWLYILLTRLLSKTGSDLLASVQAKVQKALEVVR